MANILLFGRCEYKMKKVIFTALAIIAGIIIILGINAVRDLKKYHDENSFADIEVTTKGRSLDPYEEDYHVKTFADTCIKGSVMVLEPKDYTVTVMNVDHDGQVDFKVNSRGGLWADGVEYGPKDTITLHEGEEINLVEAVTDMEFIIEVKINKVYYR